MNKAQIENLSCSLFHNLLKLERSKLCALKRNTNKSFRDSRNCLWFLSLVSYPEDTIISDTNKDRVLNACFVIATLFCSLKVYNIQQSKINQKSGMNFGNLARVLYIRKNKPVSIERRFQRLLDSSQITESTDLRFFLLTAIREDINIPWYSVLNDVIAWETSQYQRDLIRIKWARSFYESKGK